MQEHGNSHSPQSLNEQPQWQLTAITEALGDLTLTVTDSLSVGRGKDNDIVLGSKQVSRNHALLSVLNGKLYLKDLGSSNGTFINDTRIEASQSKQLKSNDTVSFSALSFKVVASAPANILAEIEPTDSAISASSIAASDQEKKVVNTPKAAEPSAEALVDTPGQADLAFQATSNDSTIADPDSTAATTSTPTAAASTTPESLPANNDPEVLTSVLPPNEALTGSENKSVDIDQPPPQPLQPSPDSATAPVALATKQPTPPVSPEAPDSAVPEAHIASSSHVEAKQSPQITSASPSVKNDPVSSTSPQTERTMSKNDSHDKTTHTELQREADPEALKAKQAAAAQFSGTANLGDKQGVGTAGNNAADQAAHNPATHPSANKKSSGSWFIWLFLGLIILALALWVFNIGGVDAP